MKQQKIQVALCITELETGGAEKMLVELASKLDRERFQPVIYSLRPENYHQKSSFIPLIREKNIDLFFLDIRTSRDLFRGLLRLRRMLKKQKANVLQCFMFHANLMGRLAGKMAGIPLICSGIRVAEREKKWHLRLDRWSQFLVDQYICVSQAVADFTIFEGKINRSKIISIPNGIDFSAKIHQNVPYAFSNFEKSVEKNNHLILNDQFLEIQSSEIAFSNNKRLSPALFAASFPSERNIVFTGRLTKQKGLDWLLETTPFWLKSFPNWRLWIIGDGEERSRLENQAKSLDMPHQIFFPGWRSDVSEILSQADLFILPSRWEGMPNALLEAMAHRLPVLATQAEGVLEILGQDLSAVQTVSFGQTDDFVQKIQFLMNHETIRKEIGLKNQNRVIEHFSIQKMVEQYENFWIKCLTQS